MNIDKILDQLEHDLHERHFRKPLKCAWCKHETDVATGNEQKPSAGSAFLCVECGRLSVFLGVSELRKPTYDEFVAFMKEPYIALMLLAWKHAEATGFKRP